MDKTTEEKKEYHRKWREDNPDKIKAADEKFRKSDKRKEYLKGYRKTDKAKSYKKKYDNEHKEKQLEHQRKYNNSDKGKAKNRKYYYTPKGTANMLRKHDKKRLGITEHKLTWQIVEMVNERDKECVYCGCELNGNVEYDHINPFKPFSKYNIARACDNCNKDKSRANMIEWMNFKGYKISQKLLDLYEKAYS